MKNSPRIDAFTQSVISRINPKIAATFNEEQIEAIAQAIYECRPTNQHWINFRGFIPLFFARFYFVFLFGRDRRTVPQKVEHERRGLA